VPKQNIQSFPYFICTDVDECSDDDLNDCDEHATCENSEGSYSCECQEGYSGDGKTCEGRCCFVAISSASYFSFVASVLDARRDKAFAANLPFFLADNLLTDSSLLMMMFRL